MLDSAKVQEQQVYTEELADQQFTTVRRELDADL